MKNLLGLLCFVLLPFLTFAYTGEIEKSYDTPGKHPTGLTFDGELLWLADRKADLIYCIYPGDGTVVRSIPSPGYWPVGMAWDGEFLWNADLQGGVPQSENYDGKIYKLDPQTGTVLWTVNAPSSSPTGLTWDGKYLWCADNHTDEIIQFSPDDGTTIRSFRSPSGDTRGLSFDGTYLWVSDRITDEIYMVEPETGSVILITDAPGPYVMDLAFDGKNLWAVDDDQNKIFQLNVNDGEKYIRFDERHARVTYTHQTTNFGPGKVLTMDVHLAVPETRVNQDIIGDPQFSPDFTDIVTDKWGQKTALFHYDSIKSDEQREAQMINEVKTYALRYFIFPEEVGNVDEIPPSITQLYLEDNDKYQMDHPVIQDAVKISVGNEKNAYWIARKIFNYLIDNMYYEMAGGWNTAPTVLARGNGSCSEYSFVYISMCRAAGLPARYVGSVVIRGDNTSMDDVFHRWVEVYLPNYGWVPIDPSGGDQNSPRNQARYIGNLANRFLITTQSGGGSKTMAWTYNSNEWWTAEPKTNVVTEHFADWEPVR